jgi:hypothetical protein
MPTQTIQQTLKALVNIEKELDAIQSNPALLNYDSLLKAIDALNVAVAQGPKTNYITNTVASLRLSITHITQALSTPKAASEQLNVLSKYAVSQQDKNALESLSRNIINIKLLDKNSVESLNNELNKVQHIRFEGKGGTDAERTYLSAFAASVFSFIRNLINFITCNYFENNLPSMPKTEAEKQLIDTQLESLSTEQKTLDKWIENLCAPKASDHNTLSIFPSSDTLENSVTSELDSDQANDKPEASSPELKSMINQMYG